MFKFLGKIIDWLFFVVCLLCTVIVYMAVFEKSLPAFSPYVEMLSNVDKNYLLITGGVLSIGCLGSIFRKKSGRSFIIGFILGCLVSPVAPLLFAFWLIGIPFEFIFSLIEKEAIAEREREQTKRAKIAAEILKNFVEGR